MSERFQDRYYDEETRIKPIPSPREVLSKVAEKNLKSRAERKAIKEYKEIVKQFDSCIAMERHLASRTSLDIKIIKGIDKKLADLENTEILMEIYKREANIADSSNGVSDVEKYLQEELGKIELKKFFIAAWPFIVVFLIIILGAISMNLLGALFLAIPIVPLGFLILFFFLQWIIGKEKMKKHGTFITITLLIILVVFCFILSAVIF